VNAQIEYLLRQAVAKRKGVRHHEPPDDSPDQPESQAPGSTH
jgi:hypothetical protein